MIASFPLEDVLNAESRGQLPDEFEIVISDDEAVSSSRTLFLDLAEFLSRQVTYRYGQAYSETRRATVWTLKKR